MSLMHRIEHSFDRLGNKLAMRSILVFYGITAVALKLTQIKFAEMMSEFESLRYKQYDMNDLDKVDACTELLQEVLNLRSYEAKFDLSKLLDVDLDAIPVGIFKTTRIYLIYRINVCPHFFHVSMILHLRLGRNAKYI